MTTRKVAFILSVIALVICIFIDMSTILRVGLLNGCLYGIVMNLNIKWFEIVRATKVVINWCDRRLDGYDDNSEHV